VRTGVNSTRMGSARDRREGDPAYEQWKKEYEVEQAAANAADPEFQFKQAANADAEANRQTALTKRLSHEYLSAFGTVEEGHCSEEQKAAARIQFREATPEYIRTAANGQMLCDMVDRNHLHPGAVASYLLCHALLQHWTGYPDLVVPVEQPAPVEVIPPSDQAIIDHQNFLTEIVGTDELGKSWTAAELDALPAKEELRLRRLFEQGHRGSNLLTVRREVLDIKQQQDAERARQQ